MKQTIKNIIGKFIFGYDWELYGNCWFIGEIYFILTAIILSVCYIFLTENVAVNKLVISLVCFISILYLVKGVFLINQRSDF